MSLPDPGHFRLKDGVVPEATSAADRIVLWIAGRQDDESVHWERISTLRADVVEEYGLRFIGATSMPLVQRRLGFWGRIKQRLGKDDAAHSWITPAGDAAEPSGHQRTDLMLVWTGDPSRDLDEGTLRLHWPQAKQLQRLGDNLALLAGVEEQQTDFQRFSNEHAAKQLHAKEENFDELSRPENNPRHQAEALLAQARQQNDKLKEASALIDLGAVLVKHGGADEAVRHLEAAVAIARQAGQTAVEYDALANLGTAYLAVRRIPEAMQILNRVLAQARQTGDRFSEKMTLDQMGIVYSAGRDSRRALACHEAALKIARDVGDRKHEAAILWNIGICYEEMDARDEAIRIGQLSLDLHQQMGSPQAEAFSEHLQKLRLGAAEIEDTGPPTPGEDVLASTLWSQTTYVGVAAPPVQSLRRPGFLRMAYTGTSSLAKFIGSGFKTVSREANKKRLEVCGECEHHTGVRCRLCGCFTAQKAWLPHEQCPLGKWPV